MYRAFFARLQTAIIILIIVVINIRPRRTVDRLLIIRYGIRGLSPKYQDRGVSISFYDFTYSVRGGGDDDHKDRVNII